MFFLKKYLFQSCYKWENNLKKAEENLYLFLQDKWDQPYSPYAFEIKETMQKQKKLSGKYQYAFARYKDAWDSIYALRMQDSYYEYCKKRKIQND